MTYKKETCAMCVNGISYKMNANNFVETSSCTACQGNGFVNIRERTESNKLINNKPSGTSARDGFNYGL